MLELSISMIPVQGTRCHHRVLGETAVRHYSTTEGPQILLKTRAYVDVTNAQLVFTCRKVGAPPSCMSTLTRGSMKASNMGTISSEEVKISRASVR